MLQKLSQKQIGEKFGISQAGVSQIVKKRSSIEAEINTEKNENRKRISDGQTFPKVNAAVLEWYQRVRGKIYLLRVRCFNKLRERWLHFSTLSVLWQATVGCNHSKPETTFPGGCLTENRQVVTRMLQQSGWKT